MRKLICLFIGLASLNLYAGDLITLSAHLDGANAVPPNDSPLVADASLRFGTTYIVGHPSPIGPPSGILTSNTLLVLVFFFPSNLVNDLGISPNVATVQDGEGNVITNLHSVANNPNALGPFPGGSGVPELKYSGFFVLTPDQANDLLTGKWYVHISA